MQTQTKCNTKYVRTRNRCCCHLLSSYCSLKMCENFFWRGGIIPFLNKYLSFFVTFLFTMRTCITTCHSINSFMLIKLNNGFIVIISHGRELRLSKIFHKIPTEKGNILVFISMSVWFLESLLFEFICNILFCNVLFAIFLMSVWFLRL